MESRVLLTVDTELSWRQHLRGASWRDNLARSYDPAGVGVPYQLRLLGEHKLKACFFIDPMPALVYGIEVVERMVAPVLEVGQEVQLHLHPSWQGLSEGQDPPVFELTGYDAGRQRALIETARDLLVAAGAPMPVAFRAGTFAANEATLDALAAMGMVYDSSHDGSYHPCPSALPLDPRRIAPVECRGVIEIPVTQIEQQSGKLRRLQLCAVSAREMEAALLHAAGHRHPLTTIVTHSFELASTDRRRPNRMLCRRFEALCRFLDEHRETLPSVRFSELDGLPLDAKAEPLPHRPLRMASRMAEQLWSNAVYERAL